MVRVLFARCSVDCMYDIIGVCVCERHTHVVCMGIWHIGVVHSVAFWSDFVVFVLECVCARVCVCAIRISPLVYFLLCALTTQTSLWAYSRHFGQSLDQLAHVVEYIQSDFLSGDFPSDFFFSNIQSN